MSTIFTVQLYYYTTVVLARHLVPVVSVSLLVLAVHVHVCMYSVLVDPQTGSGSCSTVVCTDGLPPLVLAVHTV
jgi:hypothetical protein